MSDEKILGPYHALVAEDVVNLAEVYAAQVRNPHVNLLPVYLYPYEIHELAVVLVKGISCSRVRSRARKEFDRRSAPPSAVGWADS